MVGTFLSGGLVEMGGDFLVLERASHFEMNCFFSFHLVRFLCTSRSKAAVRSSLGKLGRIHDEVEAKTFLVAMNGDDSDDEMMMIDDEPLFHLSPGAQQRP